jgi:hypothetical protein
MSCKFGCNFKCRCDKESLILQINNNCNKHCFHCPQVHDKIKTTLNREKLIETFETSTIDFFVILGGEFSILDTEDIEFIYDLIFKYNKQHIICTNNMDIYEKGIKYERHITDFTYVPQDNKIYSIVALDDQLETIYNYMTMYSTIKFNVYYDRYMVTPYKNIDIFNELLLLPNIQMPAYNTIQKLVNLTSSHAVICSILSKMCKCSGLVTCYS